ncbi:MAG: ribonucleotide-diphosphate reductase subunit beta [Polyangiaceae bacterium]|nr:ribonucleotide-diphosphate reductase subunit beta [Polyangiaceae bacterium]
MLDPGLHLTLRPMQYPAFYEMYRAAIRNTWTVEEVDFSTDLVDLRERLGPAERHMIQRLVAFFATGDSIVADNLAVNLYRHINAPEARMYLSRQLYEEALHVQFYLTLLDTYVPDPDERARAFVAIDTIPSIRHKADCLFFFAAFAYVYFLRSRGLLHGLAAGTNWVFRDESAHMGFALEVVRIVREEEPDLFDEEMADSVRRMLDEAIQCEHQFADDLLGLGVAGLSPRDMRSYLEFIADQRLVALGLPPRYRSRNPFSFMDLQDVQELANFFERRVSAYQVGVTGAVSFDESF